MLQATEQQANSKQFFFFKIKTLIYNKNAQGDTIVRFDTITKLNGEVKIKKRPLRNRVKKWFRNKMGEPPVIFDSTNLKTRERFLEGYLRNKGYFNANVDIKFKTKNKRTTVFYNVATNVPSIINSIQYYSQDANIEKLMRTHADKSLLRVGKIYDLNDIRLERLRIVESCKNHGYFNFNQDYVYFRADTSNFKIDLLIIAKPPNDSTTHQKQVIKKIVVTLDANDFDVQSVQFFKIKDIDFIANKNIRNIRYSTICDYIAIKENEEYSVDKTRLTYNQLTQLGVFKFIKINTRPIAVGSDSLEVTISLSQNKRSALNFDVEASNGGSGNTEAEYLVGTSLSATYRNRSIFRGGEQFLISVRGGIEYSKLSLSTNERVFGISGSEITGRTSISFPKFFIKFIPLSINRLFTLRSHEAPKNAKSRLSFDYSYLQRFNQYELQNVNGNIGYEWNQTMALRHKLDVVGFTFTKPLRISDTIKNNNPLFFKSIQEQVILGSGYSLYYDNSVFSSKNNTFSAQASVEITGNILTLANRTIFKSNGPFLIFKIPYSQFVKFNFDFRKYNNFGSYANFAMRFTGGCIIPYGNNENTPFVRAFFAGGNNSLRAWRTRGIGPGAYQTDSQELDNVGDIRLEANFEHRFPLYSVMKGAWFVDAGNIWALRKDPLRVHANFDNEFYKQIAVAAGIGFRFDFTYFIMRFDLAVPVRDPYYAYVPGETSWVIKDFNPFSKIYRRNNIEINLAIGYPF